jgi:DNA-directed RNA polymerase subunit omega
MEILSAEELLGGTGSVYKLVILAARRALELSEGAPALVEADSKEKPLVVALREIAEGKVFFRLRKKEKAA